MDSNAPLEDKIIELEKKIKFAHLPISLMEKLTEEISVLRMGIKGENAFINFENFSNYVIKKQKIFWISKKPKKSWTRITMDYQA